MLLAGIQKKSLDARLRGHDRLASGTHSLTQYLEPASTLARKVLS
jgi:hypothetical protein